MRLHPFLAAAMLAAGLAAHADTVRTFDTTGTFTSGATLSGTVTIDTTSGAVTGIDITVGTPESLTFTTLGPQTDGTNDVILTSVDGPNSLSLVFDTASLAGYTGGPLGSLATSGDTTEILNLGVEVDALEQGQAAPVPEPSSFVLLGTGLLGFAGSLRRRYA